MEIVARLARSVIDELQLRIIGAADPDWPPAGNVTAPTIQCRIAFFRYGAPSPAIIARLFVISLDEAAAVAVRAEAVAGDQDLAVGDHGRRARERDFGATLRFPDLRARPRVQRQDMAVAGGDIDTVMR